MSLRIVGAGLGRTGTGSLKLALERLLGAPCYHMREVFDHPEHVPVWKDAALGRMPRWESFLGGYAAAVDWPAASFWRELADAHPGAVVLLSVRDPEEWWGSVEATIMHAIRAAFSDSPPTDLAEWSEMVKQLWTSRFTSRLEKSAWITAFNEHNDRVRNAISRERLLEWTAGDGWEPLCAALDVPIPDEPFPWTNKREDWGSRPTSTD